MYSCQLLYLQLLLSLLNALDQSRDKEVYDLSYRQLEEFTQLGKFQLGQIRSQLDYEAFLKNYDLNLEFQLRCVGIISAQSRAGNNSKCFGDLGCLEISERWYDLSRPVNLLPLDREVINTKFLLRTRQDRQERSFSVSNMESVKDSGFDGKNPTKIIIHGFIDTGFETWVKEMSDALLDLEDLNVVSVDWGGGSLPLYSQAAANTRLVGLEVSMLVNKLITEHGVEAGDVHIIGHSLGSHIAGYAGERIPALGRISGLDPAEPLFQGMPDFVRLDPTDALFVDVIHTDAKSILMGGYGLKQPIGHVDFYPNGGEVQPGCSLLELPSLSTITVEDITLPSADTVGRHLVACAHNRAIHLFIDSIRNMRTCPMVGHKCSNYEQFKTGTCFHCGFEGEDCVVMGYGAKRNRNWPLLPADDHIPIKLYLETGPVAPFCTHPYLLEIALANPIKAENWVQGFIKVNLYGEKGELTEYNLTPE